MDIKKPGNLPPVQPETPLSAGKSGSPARLPATPTPAVPGNWQAGQILQALVLEAGPEQLLLRIQNLQARTPVPPNLSLQAGDRLQLQVLDTRSPPGLKLLEVQSGTAGTLNRALRNALPRQQPLPPLLANVEFLSRHPQAADRLDKSLGAAVRQFYYALPTVNDLRRPGAIKQALQTSGLFLEQQLRNLSPASRPLLQQDTRVRLLRLASQLQHYLAREIPAAAGSRQPLPEATTPAPARPAGETGPATQTAPPVSPRNPLPQPAASAHPAQRSHIQVAEQLLQQTEGALARLHIHQLHHLKTEESGRPVWSAELPVRGEQGINLFDLRIQREPPPANWQEEEEASQAALRQQARWSVRLAFDLEGLGPVQAVISLQQERISVRFHAEQSPTQALFARHLDMLGSRLRQAGLEVASLDCRRGRPEPLDDSLDTPILDARA